MTAGDQDAAARAAETARDAEVALHRAVARMPMRESGPRRRPPSRLGWEALALG